MDKLDSDSRTVRLGAIRYWWLWLAVATVVGYGIFQLGGNVRVGAYHELQLQLANAYGDLHGLRGEVAELRGELAALRLRRELDQQTNRNIGAELIRLRRESIVLRKELELYSRLVGQNSIEEGVVLHQFSVAVTKTADQYSYDLVLAQALTSTQKVVGEVEIALVDLAGVTLVEERAFEFRVFQKFTGVIIGPPKTEFDQIKVRLKITINGEVDTVLEFSWRELLGEQVDEES